MKDKFIFLLLAFVLSTLSTSSEQRHLDELSDTIANLDDDNIIVTVH